MANTHSDDPSGAFRGSSGELAASPPKATMIDSMSQVFMAKARRREIAQISSDMDGLQVLGLNLADGEW